MKRKIAVLGICIGIMSSLGACTIKHDKEISRDVIDDRKELFEDYLEETYPDEEFTVKVWQEYAYDVGGAGLPDYEGYLLRSVVIDSEGNCFQVYVGDHDNCWDDYQKVLDGRVHYNEKGQHVVYDEDGNIISEYY